MQRIIQRGKAAKRSLVKKAKKVEEAKRGGEAWERNHNRMTKVRELNARIREERKNRRIDWEAGALAPRRDVGDLEKTYGTVDIYNLNLPEKDPEKRTKEHVIFVGDRVVITRGRDRGRIGEVENVDEASDSVRVKDLNVIEVFMPEWLKRQHQDDRDLLSQAQPISLKDVRLVYPLPNPETGIPEDVVIERLVQVGRHRVVAGTTTVIPRPQAEEEEDDSNAEPGPQDTPKDLVEEVTFRRVLLRYPMPSTVIDELRNKYGRFRTRHDYEFRVQKEREDDRQTRRKDLINTMRTPLQELAELRQQQKERKKVETWKQQHLTEAQLEQIGQVMLHEQQRERNPAKPKSLPR